MRPIDADAFWKNLTSKCEEDWADLMVVYELLEEMPTIEERKTGRWIEVDDADDRISGRCSNCGWEAHLYEDDVVGMPYCPNCGARMARGEEHG